MGIKIRKAELRDLPQLLDIYNYEVVNGVATLDLEEKSLAERREWFDIHNVDNHPLYVAVADKGVTTENRVFQTDSYDNSAVSSENKSECTNDENVYNEDAEKRESLRRDGNGSYVTNKIEYVGDACRDRMNLPYENLNDKSDVIAGYVSLSPYREKEAYKSTVELSIYIGAEFRKMGIATALMKFIIDEAKRDESIHNVVSVITAGNEDSQNLHKMFGFEFCGTIREVGMKFGRYLDIDNFCLIV